jgi:soluble lytic murein transglycosylase
LEAEMDGERAGKGSGLSSLEGEATATHARIADLISRARDGDPQAHDELEGLVEERPADAVGDHAALALGGALLDAGQPRAALPLLLRAARGATVPLYARLVLADAVYDAGDTRLLVEARGLVVDVLDRADTAALRREARWRLLRLESAGGSWQEAASSGILLLGDRPARRLLDEARWLTAEALRRSDGAVEALELYRAIWHENPAGPFGDLARGRIAAAGASTEPAAPAERLRWVERLQRGGMHERALEALGPLLVGQVDAEVRARATYLAAKSHLARRENLDVLSRAHALRRASPRSQWAAKAGLEAMRALARQERTRELRAWEEWLRGTHPGTEATDEARYVLGTYLGGAGFADQGLRVLREVAAGGGPRSPHSLWQVAWIERRRGRTAEARVALARLEASTSNGAFRAGARYWLAQFASQTDAATARDRYRQLASESPRGYYGYLASDRLEELGDGGMSIPAQPAFPGMDLLRDPSRRPEPAYRRAVELRRFGLDRFAVAELETLDLGHDPVLRAGLAYLRARAGEPSVALEDFTAFEARLENEPLFSANVPLPAWRVVYPLPYRHRLADIAEREWVVPPLDGWLIAAVARRESRFAPRAVSPAGALGLLQLMPRTAADTAKRLGRAEPAREDLFDPATNLELGAAKLASLLSAFGGNVAPALAAYNAGETVARGWWSSRPAGQQVEEWVETIPYAETRIYVKAVIADWRSYRELYGRLR